MNEVAVTFALLVAVLAWRVATKFRCVQELVHKFGPLAPFLQWYSLLFLGLGYLFLRTFFNVVMFEYLRYHFLRDTYMNPDFIPGVTEAEMTTMVIPRWMRLLALGAPVAGLAAGLVVLSHVAQMALANFRRRKKEPLPWMFSKEADMVLVVIAMPFVFVLMAVRAESRVLAVMTGSCFIPYHGEHPPVQSWATVKALETGTYTNDLELACSFQYFTVFIFGHLCASYLRDAPREYRRALKWAGLQGLYLYVIVGLGRSVGTLAVTAASMNPQYAEKAAEVQDHGLAAIGAVFNVASLLCVYNMLIIGKMADVKKVLGNAGMKLNGTKMMIIVAQMQSQCFMALTVGSSLYVMVEQQMPQQYSAELTRWKLTTYQARLLHAVALNYECLLVVLWNRFSWDTKTDYTASGGAKTEEDIRSNFHARYLEHLLV